MHIIMDSWKDTDYTSILIETFVDNKSVVGAIYLTKLVNDECFAQVIMTRRVNI